MLRFKMAAASNERQETKCPVCRNDFTTPKLLRCGHLLCRQCIISCIDSSPDAHCILCEFPLAKREEHSNPSSSDIADALPTDVVMETLVDNATTLNKDHVCCACDAGGAEFICIQCRDILCAFCCMIHKKMSISSSHDVESLSSVTPGRLAARRTALCADHKDKQADVFCVDHGVCVCTACAIAEHRLCPDVRDIDSEMKSAEESMKRQTDILLNAEGELKQSIVEIDKGLQEANAREHEDIAEVDEVCERLQKLVEGFCYKMKGKCHESHSEVKKSIHGVRKSLDQRLGIVTSHRRIMSRSRFVAPRPALIHAAKSFQDRINSLDLRPALKMQVLRNPPSYGTRCQDIFERIKKKLKVATWSTDLQLLQISRSPSQETISAEAQTFWLQWVEGAFPDLDSSAYFLPPVNVKRVETQKSKAGRPSLLHHSDVRHDAVVQRVFCCLQKMSEQNGEVLVGMSQFQFGQYLGQPCYSAAAAHLLESSNLRPALSGNSSAADCDVLLIHRQLGLVALEIKCFGDSLRKRNMSEVNLDDYIRRHTREAVSQLDKTMTMLSHLVTDIAPGLGITTAIAFPNLTARQVQQAISGDLQLTQEVCRCLGTTDPENITGLCLCSDQLSNPRTPWKVSSHVLKELGNWWQRRVAASGVDSHITFDLYKTLAARLCGPATTVAVPCTSPPRLCVKTLGQAVSLTEMHYTAQITLFPEQVYLLNTAPPRLFVAGPPGTGKTVVLLLMAIQWLRCGNDVYIVSTWWCSRAACIFLYHLLLQTVSSQMTGVSPPGHPHLLQYDFDGNTEHVEKAVNDLSKAAKDGTQHVITDEVGFYNRSSDNFKVFCKKLLLKVPGLRLWAASCYHGNAPARWRVDYLTRPLRYPPSVLREVQQDEEITFYREVQEYSERGVSAHTDGPPVRRLRHGGQGHSDGWPGHCVTCGREVASLLHSLRVGVPVNASTTVNTTSGGTTPPCLQWRDVLVLYWGSLRDQQDVVTGLREAGIPVRLMKSDDTEDMVTARSDVVWVANGGHVGGLERKVVVCLGDNVLTRLHLMSRCTSQLVIVSR